MQFSLDGMLAGLFLIEHLKQVPLAEANKNMSYF
jgi:hypothetical protein